MHGLGENRWPTEVNSLPVEASVVVKVTTWHPAHRRGIGSHMRRLDRVLRIVDEPGRRPAGGLAEVHRALGRVCAARVDRERRRCRGALGVAARAEIGFHVRIVDRGAELAGIRLGVRIVADGAGERELRVLPDIVGRCVAAQLGHRLGTAVARDTARGRRFGRPAGLIPQVRMRRLRPLLRERVMRTGVTGHAGLASRRHQRHWRAECWSCSGW